MAAHRNQIDAAMIFTRSDFVMWIILPFHCSLPVARSRLIFSFFMFMILSSRHDAYHNQQARAADFRWTFSIAESMSA